jgi:hypothetical protein
MFWAHLMLQVDFSSGVVAHDGGKLTQIVDVIDDIHELRITLLHTRWIQNVHHQVRYHLSKTFVLIFLCMDDLWHCISYGQRMTSSHHILQNVPLQCVNYSRQREVNYCYENASNWWRDAGTLQDA